MFPNSILINAKDLSVVPAPIEDCPAIVKIGFPINYSNCRIIDGQHRLLGFSQLPVEELEKHYLPVIALQAYDLRKEVRTFIDINSKQQKINGNLILLLKADFEWNKDTHPEEFKQKIAVEVVRRLADIFLKNSVYFGSSDQRIENRISLSTLVSSLVKNNLIQFNLESTWNKVNLTFSLIYKYMPLKEGSFFKRNSGIRVLFRLINLFERNVLSQKISVSEEEFFHDLSKILDTNTIDELERSSGTFSGALIATESLVQKFKNYDKKYDKMESNLRSLHTSLK